jgi:copper resistance protein B
MKIRKVSFNTTAMPMSIMSVSMLLAMPLANAAQNHDTMNKMKMPMSDMSGMDHSSMDMSGMDMSDMDHSGMDMSGMDMSDMDHGMDISEWTCRIWITVARMSGTDMSDMDSAAWIRQVWTGRI